MLSFVCHTNRTVERDSRSRKSAQFTNPTVVRYGSLRLALADELCYLSFELRLITRSFCILSTLAHSAEPSSIRYTGFSVYSGYLFFAVKSMHHPQICVC
jgi:hypothetical protein